MLNCAIIQCPLMQCLIDKHISITPIYLAADKFKNRSDEIICQELQSETLAVLIIPSSWTLEQGKEWLKQDAISFLKNEEKNNVKTTNQAE